MSAAVLAVQLAGGAAFVLLGLLNVRWWARDGDRSSGYLGLALGLLGLVTLIDRTTAAANLTLRPVIDVEAACFAGSGLALLLLRDAFIPLQPRTRRLVTLGTGAVLAFAVAVDVPGGPTPEYTWLKAVAVLGLMAVWAACTVEPIIRFWRVSKDRPAVQRARLRTLSSAYGGVVVLVLFLLAISPLRRESVASLVAYSLGLLVVPLLSIAFAPPVWLRQLWRATHERERQAATEDLLAFAPGPSALARRALGWAIGLVGGEGGMVVDFDGTVLTSAGLPPGRADLLLARIGEPREAAVKRLSAPDRGYVVAVPLTLDQGMGMLAVVSGPLTPLFGSHEITTLRQYAGEVAIALDRVRLVAALERQTARYESLLRAASDLGQGVVLTDAGRLLFANQAYLDLTGYTFAELAAMESLMELTAPTERAQVEERLRDRLGGLAAPERYESALITRDGVRVDVEVAVKLLPGSEGRHIVSLVRDITERKRVEETLREAYETQREAVEQLRRMDELKNAFLTAVSHELRTPLTAVLGFALTLEHQDTQLTPSQRLDFLSRLAANARKLDRLLADLLDLGRLTRGVLVPDFRRADVGALVRRVVREADIGEHPIRVEASEAWADIDPPKIERIVENLVANAAKHTPSGTPIHVAVTPVGESVLIRVDDEGPGVPVEHRTAIFQPFERRTA
ncbi:MAG TPA: PAS domain S-box protein, partial [Actinomycetota bacterium]|nr:PAS domain S-box protein [Actinomycetota bacterium]